MLCVCDSEERERGVDTGVNGTTLSTPIDRRGPQKMPRLLFIVNGTSESYKEDQECFVVYYESRKRELKMRLMNEGRYDERLKVRVEESTCLTYTEFHDKTN